jgi:hypothetical protein
VPVLLGDNMSKEFRELVGKGVLGFLGISAIVIFIIYKLFVA